MPRRLFIALSVVCILAAPTAASACSPMPFDLHVFMATRALQSTELEPAKRDEAERWLAAARDGKGPRWHGERQQALNKALVVLSLPEATRAPLEELSPQEQETQRRERALGLRVSPRIELAARDAERLAKESHRPDPGASQ